MWKKLLNVWREDNLMQQAWEQSYEMLEICHEMFLESVRALRKSDTPNVRQDVRDKDKLVNKYEREVRRKVITHCTVQGPTTVPSGMALVSIIIDIERIGDYTKNMVDLATTHPNRLHGKSLEGDVSRIEEAVKDNFARTREVIEACDKEGAEKLLSDYGWVAAACDNIMISLVKEVDPDLRPGDSAALALYARWLKRVNAHLRNITTGVVNPFHRIGFEPKKGNLEDSEDD